MIKDRIQNDGVDHNGNYFKPLSKSYIKKRINTFGLSPRTKPSKSNVTFSGLMVDAIRSSVNEFAIKISVRSLEMMKRAQYVYASGRPFLSGITKAELDYLTTSVKKIIKKGLK